MVSSSEIEREFRLEVKSKKLAASGVHHKTGKRGYTGTIMFPSSLLRGKEKRDYTRPSIVLLLMYVYQLHRSHLLTWVDLLSSKKYTFTNGYFLFENSHFSRS